MHVSVTAYREDWVREFNEESNRIKQIFGDELIAIHHIGSTSVPGLKAKPVIDIMPVVRVIGNVDLYNKSMTALGYECMGELGMKGRRYFRKGGDHRTHQVHIFQEDNLVDTTRHLAVRDYLRMQPDEAHLYGELKESLAVHFPRDIEAYMNGKDAFVKELERKALEWYSQSDR